MLLSGRGAFGTCMLAASVLVFLAPEVCASILDRSEKQVRFVSRSDEYDWDRALHIPASDNEPVPVSNSNALSICDCEDATTRYHGGLLCNKEGYFITDFEAVGHWVRSCRNHNSHLHLVACASGSFIVARRW
jgi:hypothetical protein